MNGSPTAKKPFSSYTFTEDIFGYMQFYEQSYGLCFGSIDLINLSVIMTCFIIIIAVYQPQL